MLKVSLESEMKERHRIAADLHDSVCGDLTAIKFYLEHLNSKNKNEDSRQVISEISESLNNALENTRAVSYKLMPPLLETMGLCAALEDYCRRLSAKTSKSFTVQCHASPVLDNAVSYELFRVIQEFTTNMLKYGNITQCILNVSNSSGLLTITITDDGIAYNFSELAESGNGAGLRNIKSRLKVVHATLEQQAVAQGNQFTITLKNSPC